MEVFGLPQGLAYFEGPGASLTGFICWEFAKEAMYFYFVPVMNQSGSNSSWVKHCHTGPWMSPFCYSRGQAHALD